jgi:hypothetical protein
VPGCRGGGQTDGSPGQPASRMQALRVSKADRPRGDRIPPWAPLSRSCVGVRLPVPQTSSLRKPRPARVTLVSSLVACQRRHHPYLAALGPPRCRDLLVVISRHSRARLFVVSRPLHPLLRRSFVAGVADETSAWKVRCPENATQQTALYLVSTLLEDNGRKGGDLSS